MADEINKKTETTEEAVDRLLEEDRKMESEEKKSWFENALSAIENHPLATIVGGITFFTAASFATALVGSRRSYNIQMKELDVKLEASKYYSDSVSNALVEASKEGDLHVNTSPSIEG